MKIAPLTRLVVGAVAVIAALAAVACDDATTTASPTAPPATQEPTAMPTASPTSSPTTQPTASPEPGFDATGNLTRDNPGQPPGVWVLVYEAPGAPALTVELAFGDESECLSEGGAVPCEGLSAGDRVRVVGAEVDGVVRVLTLDVIERATAQVTVQVFFLDERRYATGEEPFLVAVDRELEAPITVTSLLDALFAAPSAEEQARDLVFVASEATGARAIRVEDGIAHVELLGGCDSRGATFTVAQEIIPTLTQLEEVEFVKIYDPAGTTGEPEGRSNSIPGCLEP